MDLKHKSISIASNDLKQTYRERAALDIKNDTITSSNVLEVKLSSGPSASPSRRT
jgi:hypothetical protein